MDFTYQCVECGRKYEISETMVYVCPVCALAQKSMEPVRGVLRIILNYQNLSGQLDPYSLNPRDFLPVDPQLLPDYPVGNTPLHTSRRIREEQQFPNLYFKDESANPTASLKDRASLLVAALARKMGSKRVVVASTGNAGCSMAGVAAHCGLECILFIPQDAPKAKLVQSMSYGARVIPIIGTYDDAFELSLKYTGKYEGINRNTAYNPFTIEGKKTAAIEIFIQLGNRAPDIIFIPTGDGVILSGMYKGFYDLFQFDWIDRIPRLIAVQPEGSDAIVRSIHSGQIQQKHGAKTVADSLCVEVPRNGIMAIKDIRNTDGFGVTVSDLEIMDAQTYLGAKAGIFAEPAAACAFAGFLKVREQLDREATIVILLTGSGLKNIPAAQDRMHFPEPVAPDIDVIESILNSTEKKVVS